MSSIAIATIPIPPSRDFDWQKAAVCLRHVLEMDRGDRTAQGKLALCEGYRNLLREAGDPPTSARKSQANFEESVSLIPALARSAPGTGAHLRLFAEEHRQGDRGDARSRSAWVFSPDRARWKKRRMDIAFERKSELNQAPRRSREIARHGGALLALGPARLRSRAPILRAHRRFFQCQRRAARSGR